MKKIIIDCRLASEHVGLGRYTREVAKSLVLTDKNHSYILMVRSPGEPWLSELKDHCCFITANFDHYSYKEQIWLPKVIKMSRADVLFSPHFNVPLLCPIPFVVTIHDLILHAYPNNVSLFKRLAYLLQMKYTVSKAKQIISVSEFTKTELLEHYGKSVHEKTVAIHEGIDQSFAPASQSDISRLRTTYNLPDTFFLYVGNMKQHKNVNLLIAAHRASGNTTPLVLLSFGKEAVGVSDHDNVRILRGISDEDLPILYSAARCFFTASLYEGFCFPTLEARACGCPVVATNGSAIAELAPPDTILLEPTIEAFTDTFANPPSRPTLQWTPPAWSDCSKKTAEVIDIVTLSE